MVVLIRYTVQSTHNVQIANLDLTFFNRVMVVMENQQLLIPVVWSSLVAAQGSMLSTGGLLAFVVSSFGRDTISFK